MANPFDQFDPPKKQITDRVAETPDFDPNPAPPKSGPNVFDAFDSEAGIGDYAETAATRAAGGALEGLGSAVKGGAVVLSADPKDVTEIEGTIGKIRSLPWEQAEAFRSKIRGASMNPAAKVAYEAALRSAWKGDDAGAKSYLEKARMLAIPGNAQDMAAYKAADEMQKRVGKDFAADPRLEGGATDQISTMVGQTATYLIPGAAEIAGPMQTADAGYDQARDAMKKRVRDDRGGMYNSGLGTEADRVARNAGQAQVLPGATEKLPIDFLFEQVGNRIPGFKGTGLAARSANLIKRVAAQVAVEGGQEAAQQYLANSITRAMVDPSFDPMDQVWENAKAGGTVGAIFQGVAEALGAGRRAIRRDRSAEEPAPAPAAPQTPPERQKPTLAPGTAQNPANPPQKPSSAPVQGAQTRPAPGRAPLAPGFNPNDPRAAGAPVAQPAPRNAAPFQSSDAGITPPAPGNTEAVLPPETAQPSKTQPATPSDNTENQQAPAGQATFKTAKGSSYVLHEDGTTSRNKAYRPEHGPSEQGPMPRSETTFFVKPEDTEKLSLIQATTPHPIALEKMPDGKFALRYKDGPDAGKWIRGTVVEPQQPAVGMTPVETWKDGTRVHFGNAITEFSQGPENNLINGSPAPQPGTAPTAPRVQTASYPPSQADKAFSTFFASKAPITPEGLAQAAGMPLKDAVKAVQRAALRGSIIQTRAGKWIRAPRRVKPISATAFIASIGGIKDDGGELRARDLHKAMTEYGPVVRPTGLPFDRVLEALVDAGYINDPARDNGGQATLTLQDVVDLLDKEQAGQKVYTPDDQGKADELAVKAANAKLPADYQPVHRIAQRFGLEAWEKLQGALADSGTTEADWHPQELADAARFISEGREPSAALEYAAIRYNDDLLDPDKDIDGSLAAALAARDPDAMIAFGPPSDPAFPLEEPSDAADQGTARGEGERPAPNVEDDRQPGDEGEAPSPGEEVQSAGEAGSEEQGADGKPQLVIPGTEPDVKGAIKNAQKAPLKGSKPQKDADEGLFSDDAAQGDFLSSPPKEEIGPVQQSKMVHEEADRRYGKDGKRYAERREFINGANNNVPGPFSSGEQSAAKKLVLAHKEGMEWAASQGFERRPWTEAQWGYHVPEAYMHLYDVPEYAATYRKRVKRDNDLMKLNADLIERIRTKSPNKIDPEYEALHARRKRILQGAEDAFLDQPVTKEDPLGTAAPAVEAPAKKPKKPKTQKPEAEEAGPKQMDTHDPANIDYFAKINQAANEGVLVTPDNWQNVIKERGSIYVNDGYTSGMNAWVMIGGEPNETERAAVADWLQKGEIYRSGRGPVFKVKQTADQGGRAAVNYWNTSTGSFQRQASFPDFFVRDGVLYEDYPHKISTVSETSIEALAKDPEQQEEADDFDALFDAALDEQFGKKEEPSAGTVDKLKDKLILFASGMSRLKDFESGAHVTGGAQTRGIGLDIQEVSGANLEQMAKRIVDWQAQTFIDSGAFGIFKKNIKERERFESELSDLFKAEGATPPVLRELNAQSLLKRYDAVDDALMAASEEAGEEGYPQPLYVAPDIVGDQRGSIDLVQENGNWIKRHLRRGRQMIVPIQKGEQSLAEAFEEVAKILDTRDFIVGVPSNQKAVSDAEFAEFVAAAKPPKIHFLGTTDEKKIGPRLEAIAAAGYEPDHVSSDANMVRSLLYGKQGPDETRDKGIKRVIKDKSPEIQEMAGEKPKAGKWTLIGTNKRGNKVYEDENGVRSYLEGGVRVTESVQIIPGQGIAVDKANRPSDYLPVEEPTRTAGQAAASAAVNTVKGIDDVVKGLNALFGGNKLSSGFTFDEDTYKKALPFFKAGLEHFADAAADAKEILKHLIAHLAKAMDRAAIENMRPYIRRFTEEVQSGKVSIERADNAESEPEKGDTVSPNAGLLEAFRDFLAVPDNAFATITEARKFAADRGFTAKPGTKEAKQLDEMIEHAIVLAARDIVKASKARGQDATYRRLVDLYERQPNLGVRTSESMADQAYSTPVPLAYLASRLAGVTGARAVLEPTAGNGALLIEASPAKAHVNEINPNRAAALRSQGFRVSEKDAAEGMLRHKGYAVDTVIANPPFGAVQDEKGRSKEFTVDGWKTTQIDHVIALQALKSMADDGRAVLIVGSVKEGSDKSRSDSYNSKQKREFYWRLYKDYNVTDHFTVSGDLYKRQGAGWPVDVIVIEGKGKSARGLPAAELPKVYDSWDVLKEKLNDAPRDEARPAGDRRPLSGEAGGLDGEQVQQGLAAGSPADLPPVQGGGDAQSGPTADDSRPVREGHPDRQSADAGEQQFAEPPSSTVSAGSSSDGVRDSKPAHPRRERIKQAEAADAPQISYQPMSSLPALDTKIPTNMAAAVEDSLQSLVDEHGDIAAWIETELGYKKGELGKYLAAEQVDAAALALENVRKGAAFIIGDQTGIGKGRVVASMLRYAIRKGMTPVFVTEKPNLYGDIMRDLNDIGIAEMLGRDVKPFLTNAGVSVPLDDEAVSWFDDAETAKAEGRKAPEKRGKFLRSSTGEAHKKQMRALQSGSKDFDIVFTTYDQMNTVKGQTTDRRRLISALASNAFIVLDESHNAGGTEASEWEDEGAELNRSDYLKQVTGLAKAVMFSSATYAKRPQTMALYARTDMGKAVEKPEMIGPLIAKGGVPMQQVVASMLAKAGQYIRRERSFDGVSYDVTPVKVDTDAYRTVSRSLSRIAKFDKELKDSDEWKEIIEDLKKSGEAAGLDSATGGVSVTSTNFTSLMHNIVGQMLLAIKADSVADHAIAALKAGEKPVITVSNTMGAFIKSFAEENSLAKGADANLSFRDVLRRYLERTLRITVKSPDGTKRHIQIPVTALSGDLMDMYREAQRTVETLNTEKLPISPIDWIHYRLKKAGYRTAEITGRKDILEYGGADKATLQERSDSDISPAGRTIAVKKFNAGDIDAMILNRAGSTGLSLHAKKGFKDVRRRRMIIAQAEGNIDVHMQMLGRVHRTGQVIAPAFTQAYAEVPAEARPAAVLAKKMASLNANTTAARKSAFSADDSVDFLNKYGDQVAREYLREHPEIGAELDYRVSGDPEQEVARELTGKMALLEIEQQQQIIDEITARYKVLIDNLNALGENELEAKTVDLKAKTTSAQELKAAEGDSPFTQAAVLEEIEVKTSGKALPIAEVLERAAKAHGIQLPTEGTPVELVSHMNNIAQSRSGVTFYKKWQDDFTAYEREVIRATKTADTREKRQRELTENRQRFEAISAMVVPGRVVTVAPTGGDPRPGVVMETKRRDTGTNPLALGSWSAEIAIPDNAQRIIVPFTAFQIEGDPEPDEGQKKISIESSWAQTHDDVVQQFADARREGTETRFMVTGNILAGYDQTKGRGQIINYTDDQGNVKPGIFMARTFNPDTFFSERAVRFKTGEQVVEFVAKTPDKEVMSADKVITLRNEGSQYEFELPASRSTGGKYFLNPEVRRAAYDRWVKVGSKMRHQTYEKNTAVNVTNALMKAGATFQTTSQQDIAEEIINGGKPKAGLSQIRKAQGFYSSLLRAVQNAKIQKAPADQWMNTIRNTPGVKAEEITWTGLEDWMAQQKGAIDKSAIAAFIEANRIDVREIEKANVAGGAMGPFDVEHDRGTWGVYDINGDLVGATYDNAEEAYAALRDINANGPPNPNNPGGMAKFASYTLPGGMGYRELLLALPGTDPKPAGRIEELPNGKFLVTAPGGTRDLFDTREAAEAERMRLGRIFHKKNEKDFHNQHWSEPNVLAHVRFNERTVDGKKVLFIEEIQSDWHQQGRKKGYAKPIQPLSEEEEAEYNRLTFIPWDERTQEQRDRVADLGDRANALPGELSDGVPDAPFKTTWPELAMKRMIRWAAENGFDKIAWAPGDVQNERYDLAKHIEELTYQKRGADTYALFQKPKGGKHMIPMGEHRAAQLADQVGEELAAKIINGEGTVLSTQGANAGLTSLHGLDLKIGGGGMRGFYDKMLVDLANKMGKKWGARVQPLEITAGGVGGREWAVLDPRGMVEVDRYQTEEQAREAIEGLATEYWVEHRPKGKPLTTAHSIDVTDAMRKAAMEGQPLFQVPAVDRRNPYQFIMNKRQQADVVDAIAETVGRVLGFKSGKINLYPDSASWQAAGFTAEAEGNFDPNTRAIDVLIRGTLHPLSIVRHELIHAIREMGLFSPQEWAALKRMAQKHWIDAYGIRERYEQLYRERFDLTPEQLEDLLAEEAVAEAFANFRMREENNGSVADRIFQKLKDFLEALANKLRGMGYQTVEDVFTRVEMGEISDRAEDTKGRGFELYERDPAQEAKVAQQKKPGLEARRGREREPNVFTQAEDGTVLEDLAGNINLRYIQKPEDVKQILRDTAEEAEGFINARRGVVSNQQTAQLAAELGMSERELLRRKQGQAMNAHEIFAARALLLKSAERLKKVAKQARTTGSTADLAEFHKAMTRHAAIQEQVAGMTAEAGRALQQFQMLAGADYFKGARNLFENTKSDQTKVGDRTFTGEYGTEAVRQMADIIDAMGNNQQIGRFTRQAYRITKADILREIWINSLLSGLRTHATNILSNSLTALLQVPEAGIAAAIGAIRNDGGVSQGEAIARLTGLMEGAKEGLYNAKQTFMTGEPTDLSSKLEYQNRKAIPGKIGSIIRTPSRALMAADELFKAINYRAEINAQAVRLASREGLRGQPLIRRIAELRNNPTMAMQGAAHEHALYQTFQNQMGPIATSMMRFRDRVPGGWLIVPFLRTPANIFKYAAERTPFGFAMQEVRDRLRSEDPVVRDTQMARMALGSMVSVAIVSLAMAGLVSGAGPDDEDKKNLMRAKGWQPYSFKIGDTWYSYQRLDPLGLQIGLVADMVELGRNIESAQADKLGAVLIKSVADNVLNKSYLSGLSDFIQAVNDPERYADSYLRNFVGTLIPTLAAQVAQTMDPTLRDARTMIDRIKARIPGLSETLPARRNVFGEEIKFSGSLGPDILSPIFSSPEKDSPLADALLEADYAPSMPQRRIGDHKLTPQEYERYSEIAGKRAVQLLEKKVKAPNWKDMDREKREKILRKGFEDARDYARKKMKAEFPDLRIKTPSE